VQSATSSSLSTSAISNLESINPKHATFPNARPPPRTLPARMRAARAR
jgi:hypothetical protein